MVLTELISESLDGLCSKEQLELLNTVDSLRSQGISHYISLPQIIVCGDQSSGKSSVLEAISGVSFPVKSGLCTRFPTELILRKATHTSVKVSIIPHQPLSNGGDKDSQSNFHEQLDSLQELPELIANAKACMGIKTLGKAFSNDLLRIEINGPDRPHLTIVDLPGLIHSETKNQSASDVDLITNIVRSYMVKQRSIILAVISAKNDYANQIVLKLARDTDPGGMRTLGVITKPDTLVPGSNSERTYISLAKNMDVEFRLGWHILRNRDTDADSWTQAQRDVHEKQFFSNSAWSALSSSCLGIKTLRSRLSQLLLHQIASELPSLMDEISSEIDGCNTQLDKLGQPRTSPQEQRIYLIQISQSFQSLMQAAVDGTYTDPFFSDSKFVSAYDRRIRAVIQNFSLDFASEMAKNGRHYKITDSPENNQDSGKAVQLTREEFVNKVVDMMSYRRGRELPNSFSPTIVTDLFREQSSPWKPIVQRHIQKVWGAAKAFLTHLVTHISDPTTVAAIMEAVVHPKLEALLISLQEKALILLHPYQNDHPITYNSDFTEALQKTRLERQTLQLDEGLKQFFPHSSLDSTSSHVNHAVNFQSLKREIVRRLEPDWNRWSASEALDSAEAYYEIACKRLIDEMSIQVIETGLVAEIREILSPLVAAQMKEDDMASIVGEKEEIRTARKKLEAKRKLLSDGAQTCKKFSGFRVSGLIDDAEIGPLSSSVVNGTEKNGTKENESKNDYRDNSQGISPKFFPGVAPNGSSKRGKKK
ncbi:P-loop containing nucleoside triphosphate hydrolase protein [Trichoderma ceciliae]